jgi:hypothetical protein
MPSSTSFVVCCSTRVASLPRVAPASLLPIVKIYPVNLANLIISLIPERAACASCAYI